MSVNVMIPTTWGDPWSCTINGVSYTYKAGAVVAVPDGVAVLIAAIGTYPPAAKTPEAPIGMATADSAGLVRQGESVANAAGDTPTAEEFNALLASLRNAGVIGA